MGFFGTPDSDAPGSADQLEDIAPETKPEPPDARPSLEPSGDPVAIATPDSRRARARRQLEETITKRIGESTADLQRRLEEQGASFSTLTSTIQALQAQIQAQRASPAPAPQPSQQDDELETIERQADEALDRGDYAAHKRLNRKLSEATAKRAVAEAMRNVQPPAQQQQHHPLVMATALQFPKVLERDPDLRMVRIQDDQLDALGVPAGPARLRRAFEAANQIYGASPTQTPAYSQSSAAVLSGVPTSNAQSESQRGPSVRLSPYEKHIARKFKMSEEEYAKSLAEINPSRLTNG